MSRVLAQARTTPRTRTRTEIKVSPESQAALADCYNISRSTVRKWKERDCPED